MAASSRDEQNYSFEESGNAAFKMGFTYETGIGGMVQSFIKAEEYYMLGLKLGSEEALQAYVEMYVYETGGYSLGDLQDLISDLTSDSS